MSNSTDTTGCISHRRHTRYFIMYEDFLDVAKVSEHQYKLAAFWRVLETKTNDRISAIPEIVEDCKKRGVPIPEEHLWVEIPYSEFVNRAMGVYKSSSFQIAAAESEHLGFSKSRQLKRPINPNDLNSPMEDYKEYLFLADVMQSVLNGGEYPTPIEINSPLLNSIAARKKAKKEQKEKTAIENNTPPIEINSPPTVTPIEINSTPLLNSIGNKYISKDDKDNGKNDSMPSISSPDDASSHTPSLTQSSSVSSQDETMPALKQSTTVDNSVDKTTNGEASSLIVIDATSNRQAEAAPSQVESMTTRNASNEANTGINNDLDPEQQRIASYLEELEFDFDLTPLNKQHLTKLAKRVKSGEQMKSLKAFTENQELLKGKTIYLGNLANANNLNGWRQSEQAKQRAEAQKSAPINPSKLTSVSGMRNYSAEPEIQPTIQKPPQDGLVQIPKFSLKGLRQQMKKEGKLV